MSKGVNKVIIVGNLGQDPEVRFVSNGNVVTNISIATSDTWKDKSTGENKERTEWHKVVFWGKLAEIAGEYLRKGSQIYIEGFLQTRKWQDQSGQDRYTTEIIVNSMSGGVLQMLGTSNSNITSDNGNNELSKEKNSTNKSGFKSKINNTKQEEQNQPVLDSMDFDDDIPF